MSELTVKIPAAKQAEYKILIGCGILAGVPCLLDRQFPYLKRFIVTDSNVVAAGHMQSLAESDSPPAFIIDPPGEISKNIKTLASILETMEKAFLGRDTLVVSLGGGTAGDIAGLAAAIFKRGVPVVHIPTTTVAQADSAIGGKTGVDSSLSKNAFGAFWHPAGVFIDVATLSTLDYLQYRAGLVESIKHALIADSEYFDFLEKNIDAILKRKPDILEKIALFNCRIKASVVAEDPTEQNKRKILNYGHTIGHAVESAGLFGFVHGQAVAVGIIAAGLIEQQLGLGSDGRLKRIRHLLAKLDMPQKIPANISRNELLDALRRDKKAIAGRPKFVLLEKIGFPLCKNNLWAHDVPDDVVENAIENLT